MIEQGSKRTSAEMRKIKTPHAHPSKDYGTAVRLMILLVLVIVCILLGKIIFDSIGTAYHAYLGASKNARDSTYETVYDEIYAATEERYHVSNTGIISIAKVQETQMLVVLTASDETYVTKEEGSTIVWYKYCGEGTYKVDMQAAEFIIDNERHFVLARIPRPQLSDVYIKSSEELLGKAGFFNGNYSDGTNLAIEADAEAQDKIAASLQNNQYTQNNAETAAKSTVENLIRKFNPDVQDLTVQVEFLA